MKIDELRKILIEEFYLKNWVKKTWLYDQIPGWVWNNDGSISVVGDVFVEYDKEKLPFKFHDVSGSFYCSISLTTLENCPYYVGGRFYCKDCKGNFTDEDVKKVCRVKVRIEADFLKKVK